MTGPQLISIFAIIPLSYGPVEWVLHDSRLDDCYHDAPLHRGRDTRTLVSDEEPYIEDNFPVGKLSLRYGLVRTLNSANDLWLYTRSFIS